VIVGDAGGMDLGDVRFRPLLVTGAAGALGGFALDD
jgi:hypothetical protein